MRRTYLYRNSPLHGYWRRGNDILALVGSRTVDQLHDTVKAIDIHLSPEDLQRIEQMIPKEYASNSAMLPINLDENGLFKF